jgi:uncharacterized protein (TIGR03067 family)
MKLPLTPACVVITTAAFISISSAVAVAAVAAVGEDSKQEEIDRLEGKWKVVSIKVKGMEIDTVAVEFDFEGKKWASKPKNEGTKNGTGSFEIDPTTEPKSIDLLPTDGRDKCLPGIYKIDGDELRLCVPTEDAARPLKRPDSFDSKGKDCVVFVMRREKKP